MLKQLLTAGVVLAAAVAVRAGEGDLTYSTTPPDLSGGFTPSFYAYDAAQFVTAPKGAGTVNGNATVVTLQSQDGATTLKVAIDAKDADAKYPDLLRLDMTGKGQFAGVPTVPIVVRSTPLSFSAEIGPGKIELQRDGKTVPVTVQGNYQRSSGSRYLYLMLGLSAEGACKFGDKTAKVRVIDSDHNLKLGDPGKPLLNNGQDFGQLTGDTVLIDTTDGTFANAIKAYCGQPVQVGGVWYDLAVDGARMKVSAQPFAGPTGTMTVAHDHWTATLVGDKYLLTLGGGKAPVTLPEDKYRVAEYAEIAAPDATGRKAQLATRAFGPQTTGKRIEVAAGSTIAATLGSPLTAALSAAQQGDGQMYLTLQLFDASGAMVSNLDLPDGQRPPAPTFELFNAKGEKVYSGKLEYG